MRKKFSLTMALLCVVSMAVAAPVAAPLKFTVDANHSTVGFAIPILNGVSRVRGKFMSFAVDLEYDETNVTRSSVRAIIKTESIDTGIEARDKHLRTADFFDVQKYPEITFQSKRVVKIGKGLVAVGDFTLHGVTKEIEIPFTIAGTYTNETNKQKLVGFQSNFMINRRDYGMTWKHKSIPNFVGDFVHIELAILVRAEAPK